MYKIQIVDVFNKEILIEEDHNDLNFISELFNTSQNPNVIDCLITDSMNRTRRCKFVTCSMIDDGRDTICKMFFKTKPMNIQV